VAATLVAVVTVVVDDGDPGVGVLAIESRPPGELGVPELVRDSGRPEADGGEPEYCGLPEPGSLLA